MNVRSSLSRFVFTVTAQRVSLALLALVGSLPAALAVDTSWNVAGPADWNTGANWDTLAVPGPADNAWVRNGGHATISAPTPGVGGMTDISGPGSIVSINGGGQLNANGEAFVGWGGGNSGTLNVAAGGTAQVNHWFQAGRDGGTGTVNNSGTFNVTQELRVGMWSGNGTFNNTGGTVTVGNELRVGMGDAAAVGAFTNSGTVSGSNWISVGRDSGTGTFTQTAGSTTTSASILIGQAGNGTFHLNGGTLTANGNGDNNSIRSMSIGTNGGTGVLNTAVGTTTSVNGAEGLGVGWNGTGTLNNNGTTAVNNGVWVGHGTGTGTINNTGNFSSTNVIDVGRGGASGNGVFNNSGTVSSGGDTWIGSEDATGTYTQTAGSTTVGGNLQVGREGGSVGTMNIQGGTVNVNGNGDNGSIRSMNIARSTGAGTPASTVNVSPGATLNVNADQGLSVGWDGHGVLNNDGTTAVNNGIWVGHATGTGTITNTGTLSATNIIQVGRGGNDGNGTFNQNGGTVTANQMQVGSEDATGVLNMNAGTINVNNGDFRVGTGGGSVGTVNHVGGTINANPAGGWSFVGVDGGTGTYNLTGPGTLNTTGTLLSVGWGSQGTFNQTGAGSTVNANELWIGNEGGGNGNYTITNGTLNVNDRLGLGRDTGTGNMHIRGGTVNVAQDIVDSNGLGVLHINGGALNMLNPNSTMTLDQLRIGSDGFTGSYTNSGNRVMSITGSGSGEFLVGYNGGNGTFVDNGTNANPVTSNNWASVGRDGGTGSYTKNSAGTTTHNTLMVGISGGNGTFVQNAGTVNLTGNGNGNDYTQLTVGNYGGTGSVTINGGVMNATTGRTVVGWSDNNQAAPPATSGTITVAGGTLNNNEMWVGRHINGTGTVNVNSGSLTNSFLIALGSGAGSGGVGSVGGNGTFNQTGGTTTTNTMWVGAETGGVGTVNLSGGSLTTTGNWDQDNGRGSLSIGGNTGNNAVGDFNLSGTGSLNASSGRTTIGWTGTGTFDQTGGSSTFNDVWIGRAGGNGQMTLSSGTLTANLMAFGSSGAIGNNSMTQTGGTATVNGDLYLGAEGATGTYHLEGGALNVGGNIVDGTGSGTLNINGGTLTMTNAAGAIHVDALNIGRNFAPPHNGPFTGSHTTTGSQSITVNGELSVGRDGGTGTLTHNSTGAINTNSTWVGVSGQGTVNVNGGSFNSQEFTVGGGNPGSTGTFNQTAGAVDLNGGSGSAYLGRDAGTTGTYTMTGGSLFAHGVMFVGNSGIGTFNQNDTRPYSGAGNDTVQIIELRVGETATGVGTYNVRGANTWVHGTPVIGNGGNGTLTVNDNFSASLFETGNQLIVGNGNGAVGVVNHSAAVDAQVWAGSLHVGNQLGSNGTYNLSGNATLAVSDHTSIGDATGATGAFNQSGGTFNNGGWVGVGHFGTGTYTMSGGTLNANGPGLANNIGTLAVGFGATGNGTFTQTAGDVNVAAGLTLTRDAGSQAVYSISGGTLDIAGGSTGNEALEIGKGGTAVFNLSGTGAVTVASGRTVVGTNSGAVGTLNVSGGTLTTPDLIVALNAGSSGTVNQSGGTINVTAPSTYRVGNNGSGVPDSAGNGTVNQSAGAANVTGNMVLGDNPTTGPVANFYNLSGGTLQFGDTLTLGAGAHHQTNAMPSTLTINADAAFNFTGGTLLDVSNINTANGNTGTFHQNGTQALWEIGQQNTGPAGLTALNGNLLQTSGTIAFDVFGYDLNNTPWDTMDDMANNPIDLLIVNGDAQLGGTVDVDFIGVAPLFGDVFPLMKITGDAIIDPTFHIDGGFFRVVPDGMGNFTLQAIVPEPGSVAMWSLLALAAGGFAVRMRSRRRRG